jgi:hypothetical protein
MSEQKKVRINLQDLKVKSFFTTPGIPRDAGTVRGLCDQTETDCTATNCDYCTTYTEDGGPGASGWPCGDTATNCTNCTSDTHGACGGTGGDNPCGGETTTFGTTTSQCPDGCTSATCITGGTIE